MSSATVDQLRRLENLEKRIIKEIKSVESLEKRLSGEELELQEQEKEMSSRVNKLLHWRDAFVRNFSQQHRIIFNTLLTVGVILISRGVWEISASIPFLSSASISLVVGIAVLIVINRYPSVG
jgi:hypothetical protein